MLVAKCSSCKKWSEISWQDHDLYIGYWWENSGPCPRCGASVRVEELEKRRVDKVEKKEEVGNHKPCPHCASFNIRIVSRETGGFGFKSTWEYNVYCRDCTAQGPIKKTEKDAWKFWDTRRRKKVER